ncbi:uncharacterized protein EHS24_006950 [Apiotrichum porosum]|uniref:FAD dependent oxidoreductase domain-containing protein n=1 Tax=Apiotrichum porosum TaxID=105984 RepID=A0A427XX21_9TREE|nr:uncharacterized protein EHS24_006950 [Apiotrichum porosum]RSH83275.1 hypothetical protein EHS24_006950 [Apiotrichum porosum]
MPTTKPKPASPFGPNILPAQSTTSHWQRSTAGNAFATCGMNDALPADADVVIIGSGLSGESRRTFQSTDNRRGDRPQPAVLSQPPGLGGHPRSPRGVLWRLGKERRALSPGRLPRLHLFRPAARPRASQEDPRVGGNHIEQVGFGSGGEAVADVRVAAFVDKHNIECELVLRPTMDVCLTDSFEEYETKAFGQAKAGGIDLSGVKHLSKDVTAKECQAPDAVAGWQWSASSVNPLKLAYGVYRACYALGGFGLYAYAPVTEVVPNATSSHPWTVVTPRGSVNAAKVVHATNAYSKLLLPELDGLVQPFRAGAVKLAPAPNRAFKPLQPTMSLRRELHHFYSVAPQPDGGIVLSCSRTWTGQSPDEYQDLFDNMDDSYAPLVQAMDTVTQVAKALPSAQYGPSRAGGVESNWSGIIGFTPDAVPFVGPLPDKPGQYVIAGFNGHGMARIFHTAPCLADVMVGGMDKWDPTVPTAFIITTERLEKLRAMDTDSVVKSSEEAKLGQVNERAKL